MLLMQHPASTALACDSDESFAIRTRRIDFVIDDRLGRVSDSKARAPHPLRHLSFFLVATRAGPETLIKRSHLLDHIRAKRHVRAEYSAHLDYIFAMVGN